MRQFISSVCLGLGLSLACSGAFAIEQNLGTVGKSGVEFGNFFKKATTGFTDYYTFTIGTAGTVFGTTTDVTPSKSSWKYDAEDAKDVVLTYLALGNTSFSKAYGRDLSIPTNGTTNSYDFGLLEAGTYKLAVSGYVTRGDSDGASYSGVIRTSASVASPAPEPADLALTVMGLAGVGFMLRKHRSAA